MFYERFGNMMTIPEQDGLCLVVTTNGFVTSNGKAVMGRGIAKQIADKFPEVPYILGSKIKNGGNTVHVIKAVPNKTVLLSFPVKPDYVTYDGSNVVNHAEKNYTVGDKVAGFHAKADIKIIERSLQEIVRYADSNPQIKFFCIPRAGCGAGELDWYKGVRPLFMKYLDERFIVCNFTDDRPRYAGIGSRNTPENIQAIMTKLATKLESLGWVLRSGGAIGADSAFELGLLNQGNKEIYYASTEMKDFALNSVKEFHPVPHKLNEYQTKLMARNYYQIMGFNNDMPVKFVICWTPDGCISHKTRNINTGGTGQAISIADSKGIRTLNLARIEDLDWAIQLINS